MVTYQAQVWLRAAQTKSKQIQISGIREVTMDQNPTVKQDPTKI